MKKFLSLLLAMTMVLSLVIVPANAADATDPSGSATLTIVNTSNPGKTAKVGDTLSFLLTSPQVTDGSGNVTNPTISSVTWTVGTASSNGSYTVAEADAGKTLTVSYTGKIRYTLTSAEGDPSEKEVSISGSDSIRIYDPQTAFEAAVKLATVSFKGRTYRFSGLSVAVETFTGDELGSSLSISVPGSDYSSATLTKDSHGAWTVACGDLTVPVSVTSTNVSGTVSITNGSSLTILAGQEVELTANYTRANKQAVSYSWAYDEVSFGNSSDTVTFTAPKTVTSLGRTYTVTCTVSEGDSPVDEASITIKVIPDPYTPDRNGEKETRAVTVTDSTTKVTIAAPVLYNASASAGAARTISYGADGFTVAWDCNSSAVRLTSRLNGSVEVSIPSSVKSGKIIVTATITYNGKTYDALEYTINVTALDATLDDIVNGDTDDYSLTSIEDIVADSISDAVPRFDSSDVRYVRFVTGSASHVTLKDGKSSASGLITDGLEITTQDRYIGEGSFQLEVTDRDGETYIVTIYVPIVGKDKIEDTFTGTDANSKVTFTNEDYDGLFIYTGSASFKDEMYEGDWSMTRSTGDWTYVKKNGTYTVASSEFDRNGQATLHVVAIDSKVASTGTIVVSQKSYDITYNVVAGSSVSFIHSDFESFVEDYAKDNGDWTTKRGQSYPYVEFDHVEVKRLPNSKSEGDLRYNGTVLTSTAIRKGEYTDLSKMSFDCVAKPTGKSITISLNVVVKYFDRASSKGVEKTYPVDVVISVISEDIVYEVGVNSSVKFNDADFVSFLQNSNRSYKSAKLDHVTFDVGRNSAITSFFNGTGVLYRYYSSYGVNPAVSSSDEFYYNPKSTSKNLDLADVTYVTTQYAKVGDVVYIPFTAYGTGSQKAEGTVAIKVKQTMNFIDVRTSDYFYNAVQWAVNGNITKGTSTTTFSPKMDCTRAQIVTFLWRAAKSPEPRSSVNKFTDVSPTTHADYMKAILWATEQGITTGTDTNKFSPDATCTRAQIVTFLYRYKNSPAVSGSLSFTDVSKTEHSAYYNAILWAVNNKITTGYGSGIFDPNGTCNRGDAVTFLYRALA